MLTLLLFKNWINHPAGIFKGSRKFAWDNLIKEDLKEGLTSGEYTPSQVEDFLGKLRDLDLGGGVKFADAETGNAISEFYGYVEGRRAVLENNRKEQINIELKSAVSSASQVFFEEYKNTGSVSNDTYLAQQSLALEQVPQHKRDDLLADINQAYSMFERRQDEATLVVFDDLNRAIEDGVDLDIVKEDLVEAINAGNITAEQYDKLNIRLENTRDFDIQVLKNPSYVDLKGSYREIITGFRREKSIADIDPQTSKGYFQTVNITGDVIAEGVSQDSLYKVIKNKKGEARAKMFVNAQQRSFDRRLRNALENKFNETIAKGNTPEQARDLIEEQQDQIADKLFNVWITDSINIANTTYLQ